ncbi:sensor histidine kinase [Crocosphaera watsonii WH 8501]|uniref:histidine kinase n=2 Tax=Crocosphaera watsonii TaxID=263511 RepID=Q4C4J1_CROWT|nr:MULTISPECIES: ATP-binding protein [Crocosphaera]EAM51024.1 ATP-binding region, ATPase-like:Histidine kinase A, N-terminal [Crocosphaera watsonii WH 8501]MCH2244774.1 HAMP domain-containing histidine kinase [Crocosphaera sp.]NQZ63321.1 two-component sensor histidine kinase [Crocosphaera sp.]CCQ53286.1 two-component sensor histidine kinase [Crocosphaera watsonii WH 8502]
MFQATRRRLALWYTTVTAILLLLFATGVFFYVRSTLVERVDDTLKHVVEVVNRSLVIESVSVSEGRYQVDVEGSFPDNAEAVEDDHIDLEWFNPQGELVWSTFSDPPLIPLHLNRRAETVHLGGDRILRQVTQRINLDRYILGYLRVSHPWFEVTKPIRQLSFDLALATLITIIIVGFIGWFLSGLAIQPIRDSYQSLKQFTADASHELRNPIATIQTNVQMALSYGNSDPQVQQRQLKVVERLTQRLGNLVNDLLFLARSDSGMLQIKQQTLPLDALLIEVIEEQRTVAQQKDIFLSLHIVEPDNSNEDNFSLLGDWDQLARLFTNLISNGLEHSFSENKNIEKEEQVSAVEVELKKIKRDRLQQLKVKVKDTGKGVPEVALSHLFDRFYQVDPSRKSTGGSGLGLAIAKAIVDNHHGQIKVESELNKGTIFTVILPI